MPPAAEQAQPAAALQGPQVLIPSSVTDACPSAQGFPPLAEGACGLPAPAAKLSCQPPSAVGPTPWVSGRSLSAVSPLNATFSFGSDREVGVEGPREGAEEQEEELSTGGAREQHPRGMQHELTLGGAGEGGAGENTSSVQLGGLPLSQSEKLPRRPRAWSVEASALSLSTVNPIRKITDAVGPSTSNRKREQKPLIALGQGDPTVFGHLAVPQEATEALVDAVRSMRFNGYSPSFGLPQTRRAVAEHLTALQAPHAPGQQVLPEQVYITSGCGHSLQLCLEALSNPGKHVLLPRPGFPVYDCWVAAAGLQVRRYSLLPERNWEVDLGEVRALADEDTVALLICNPGNPCGNCFSLEHLRQILSLAEELKLPVVADEVYGAITFGGATFTPLAAVAGEHSPGRGPQGEGPLGRSPQEERPLGRDPQAQTGTVRSEQNEEEASGSVPAEDSPAVPEAPMEGSLQLSSGCSVPVLTVSSISKALLVPGWRLGWISVHDPQDVLKHAGVVQALENRMQSTPPSCSLVQAALPTILGTLSPSFQIHLNSSLEDSLCLTSRRIREIPGLDCPSQPQGGMFLMVRIKLDMFSGFTTDIEWCRELMVEQSVMVIPGSAFEFPGWFRTLLSAPMAVLEDAWNRIEAFCKEHTCPI